jgi:hypothetical protein
MAYFLVWELLIYFKKIRHKKAWLLVFMKIISILKRKTETELVIDFLSDRQLSWLYSNKTLSV